jgi:hypothetical protein
VTSLPAKLRLSRQHHSGGRDDLQATLLINEWLLGEAAECP